MQCYNTQKTNKGEKKGNRQTSTATRGQRQKVKLHEMRVRKGFALLTVVLPQQTVCPRSQQITAEEFSRHPAISSPRCAHVVLFSDSHVADALWSPQSPSPLWIVDKTNKTKPTNQVVKIRSHSSCFNITAAKTPAPFKSVKSIWKKHKKRHRQYQHNRMRQSQCKWNNTQRQKRSIRLKVILWACMTLQPLLQGPITWLTS